MACLSELVYQPFDDIDAKATRKILQNKLEKFLNEKTKKDFDDLITAVHQNDFDTTNLLNDELKEYDLSIREIYDCEGAQAFLVSTNENVMLVFRGTEKNCFKDIKADIDAVKIGCVSNGGVHRGFKNHYEKIANRIQNDLNKKEYIRKPLIIAGHSLGGALATIAAKRLIHQGGIAACYTFGAPRVGDEKWSHDVKTPIYRLVNAADCVTMLPPGGFVMDLLQMLSGSIPIVGKFIKNYLINFKGYYHIGDMRYLTSCKSGQYANVNLLYAVPSLRRMYIYFNKKIASKFIADHSISIYRRKLAIIAYKRNKTD